MAVQLGLDLPVRTALGRDDFMIAPSNAVAVAMIDNWRAWPLAKLVLYGPEASGKTHLTHVWAAECGARIIPALDLEDTEITTLAKTPIAVTRVDMIRNNTTAQTDLFHLHNLLHSAGMPLLMTGIQPPTRWHLSLPDLQSRVAAAGHASLDPPDDILLGAVLAKHFNDRQVKPRPDVIPYLITHMERSFASAQQIVSALDAASIARKKPITRALAVETLDNDVRSGG